MNILRSRWLTRLVQGISLGLISCWLLVSLAQHSLAIQIQDISDPRQTPGYWVTDMANILNPATEEQLNKQISQFEAQTTAEVVVVTVPDTTGYASPKAFTTELFNTWGIGKAETNNGVLFMVSLGDRRTEIETGIGSQAILTDAKVQAIVDNQVIPFFKAGDFNQGILAGTIAVMQGLNPNAAPAAPPVSTAPPVPAVPEPASSLTISNPHPGWLMLGILLLSLAGWSRWRAGCLSRQPKYISPQGRSQYSLSDQGVSNWLWLCGFFFSLSLGVLAGSWFFATLSTDALLAMLFFIVLASLILSLAIWHVLNGQLMQRFKAAYNQKTLPLVHCENCRDRIYPLDSKTVGLILSKPQQIAKRLGTTTYEAWHCPICVSEIASDQVYLVAKPEKRANFSECPTCQEFTVKDTKRVITEATYSHSGEGEKTRKCQCCDFKDKERYTIPRLERDDDDDRSSSSFSSNRSSRSSSSSRRRSSSSRRSSGGGRSRGGGGGGSW
ncbi:MAG: TPM domain-containing protein [Spirulina sp. SIO3F2]|nr:TPM domain-containing protein [Spirulina sp. SIO3F2]